MIITVPWCPSFVTSRGSGNARLRRRCLGRAAAVLTTRAWTRTRLRAGIRHFLFRVFFSFLYTLVTRNLVFYEREHSSIVLNIYIYIYTRERVCVYRPTLKVSTRYRNVISIRCVVCSVGTYAGRMGETSVFKKITVHGHRLTDSYGVATVFAVKRGIRPGGMGGGEKSQRKTNERIIRATR